MNDLSYRERHVLSRMTITQWEYEREYLRRHKLRIRKEDGRVWVLRTGEKQVVALKSLDFDRVLRYALAYAYPQFPVSVTPLPPNVAADLERYFDREYRPQWAEMDLKW